MGGSPDDLKAAVQRIVHSAYLVTASDWARLIGPGEVPGGPPTLPTGSDGRLVLQLNLYQPKASDE
jgi:hypothetical protein